MERNLRPLGRRLFVQPEPPEAQTKSGLHIPERSQESPTIGVIMATGPNCDPQCKVGAKVIFGKYVGATVHAQDQELRLIEDRDVLAVLEETK